MSTFSWGQKRCAYFRKCAYFGEMCFFWENVLILGSGGFLILGLVYTIKTLILELDFLFIIFEKKIFLTLKMCSVFLVDFLFVKWEKNLPDFQISMLKKIQAIFFQNKHNFVTAKRVCLLWEMSLLWVCLLCVGRVLYIL